MLFKEKIEENIIKKIYKKDRLKRYSTFILGLFLVSVSFNLFLLPQNLIYGVSGFGVILNKLYQLDPSVVILVGSLILLVLSFILLGKEKTMNSVVGSLLYPIIVKLTVPLVNYITLNIDDTLVLTIFGAVISGFGYGLIFKSGFTTGGTDILNQIFAKYFKMSIGNAMFFTDGFIILFGAFALGWDVLMYSIILLYIISIMTDKVILGISESKAFYIITEHETAVKKFITQYLSHGVTVLEGRGGFTGNNKKVIMCIIPTKEYYIAKEGIHSIDENAFFVVTDAYEVYGGE
ncbi:MAG TPA: YitT family protein [Candidatus Pelethosoma merdigallinarum]|nr:YitT family protein [Candidatus Pelethosoma merdigallinarum]